MRVWPLVSLPIFLGFLTFACRGNESLPAPPLPPDLNRRVLAKPPGSDDFAHRAFGYPLSLDDADAILRYTEAFEFGEMPPKRQVQAFNVVFEQSDATHRFESIAKGGRAAGRLYAFAGLLVFDTRAAERVRASLATDTHSILVIDSDTSYDKPVSDLATIVERREMGQWFRSVEDQANDYYRQRER